jgi:hypothetical protein
VASSSVPIATEGGRLAAWIDHLALAPTRREALYAIVRPSPDGERALVTTDDSGETWRRLAAIPFRPDEILVANDPRTLCVFGTMLDTEGNDAGAAVARSEDGGASFVVVRSEKQYFCHRAALAHPSGRLYWAPFQAGGLQVSDDHGKSWSPIADVTPHCIAADLADPDAVYRRLQRDLALGACLLRGAFHGSHAGRPPQLARTTRTEPTSEGTRSSTTTPVRDSAGVGRSAMPNQCGRGALGPVLEEPRVLEAFPPRPRGDHERLAGRARHEDGCVRERLRRAVIPRPLPRAGSGPTLDALFPGGFMSERSRRLSLLAVVATAALSIVGVGCEPPAVVAPQASAAIGPPSPPTPPQFIAGVPPRSVGTLRPATEAELSMLKKSVPFGALVHEMFSTDFDAVARVASPLRTVDVRITEHEHRIRSVRLVGPTREGLLRSLVSYKEDLAQKVERGRVVSTPSAVHGKAYVVDVGPSGVRVFTAEGYTPSPAEVQIVQEDYARYRSKRAVDDGLRRTPRELPPPVPSPVAAAREELRRSMENGGITVHDLRVEVRGVREHDGVPCAVFAVAVRGHKDESVDGSSVRAAIDLQGEYSVRLGDGWDAEVALSGLRRISGTVRKNGAALALDTVGHLRLLGMSRYDLTSVGSRRTLESLERGGPPPPGAGDANR